MLATGLVIGAIVGSIGTIFILLLYSVAGRNKSDYKEVTQVFVKNTERK